MVIRFGLIEKKRHSKIHEGMIFPSGCYLSFISLSVFCLFSFFSFSFFELIYCTSKLHAQSAVQVQRGNGPFVGRVRSLVSLNNSLYALVSDAPDYVVGSATVLQSGVYKSTNDGNSWSRIAASPAGDVAQSLTTHLGSLFITTSGAGTAFRSADEGRTWTSLPQAVLGNVTHLVSLGDTLFARTGSVRISSMFRSVDTGRTWTSVSSPGAILTIVAARGRTAASLSRTILFGGFVPSMNSLLRSIDGGLRWDDVVTLPQLSDLLLYDIAVQSNDDLYLATNKGVLLSRDNGLIWQLFNQGIEGKTIFRLAINERLLYAATNDGLYFQSGAGWESVPVSLPSGIISGLQIESLCIPEGQMKIFLGTTKGIFRGTILASGMISGWEQINRGLSGARIDVNSLALGLAPIAAGQNSGVFRAADGATWLSSNLGLSQLASATRVWASDDVPIALLATRSSSGLTTVFTSNDAAFTWRGTNLVLPSDDVISFGMSLGNNIFAGTKGGSIYRANVSTPQLWSKILFNPLEGTNTAITSFVHSGNAAFAATSNGLLQSIDGGNTWTRLDESVFPRIAVSTLAVSASTLIAGTPRGVYVSGNAGTTWSEPRVAVPSENRVSSVQSLLIRNGLFYAGTSNDGVFRSSDNGQTWVRLEIDGLFSANSMIADSSKLFIGFANGLYEVSLPRPNEFPIITRLLPSDSLIVGVGDTPLTIQGVNFTSTSRVRFDGREILSRFSASNELSITIPNNLISTAGLSSLEIINSTSAVARTVVRIVQRPQNFPQISLSNTLEPFVAFLTQVSTSQSYTLRGTNIRDSLIITVPEGFEISLNSGMTWGSGRVAVRLSTETPDLSVSVRYRPINTRTLNAQLTHSVGGFVLQTLSLNASPRSLQLLTEPPTMLEFGGTKIGQTLRRTITLINPNTVSITLATMVSGAALGDYVLSQNQFIIPPSGRASLDVLFSPQKRGERFASLTIFGAASTEISLSGRGTQAVFEIQPRSIVFSTAAYIGQALSLPREVITVRNTGDVADEILNAVLLGAANSFRVLGIARKVLDPGETTSFIIEAKPEVVGLNEAVLSFSTAERFSSSASMNVRVQGSILEPPKLLFPNLGEVIPTVNTVVRWLPSLNATHYELALEPVNSSRLLIGNTQIIIGTNTSVALSPNTAYYWTVRALVVRGQDTITRSAWQQRQFFTTITDARVIVPPLLDFGTVTMQQGETPPRSNGITVRSGVWRVSTITILQDIASQTTDASSFRVVNNRFYSFDGAILKPLAESYPVSFAFRPPRVRSTPYLAIAEIRLQNVTTNEIFVAPFLLRALATNCPQVSSGQVSQNSGCPETLISLQLHPSKAVYAPGDEVRLQVRLNNILNSSSALERFFRRLSLTIDVENMSLLSLQERLTMGNVADVVGGGANNLRIVPYSTLESLQSSLPINPNGKIRMIVERPQNFLSGVLAEIQGKAVIGLKGLGQNAEQSLESVLMRISDVQWLGENDVVPDSGQVLLWHETQSTSISQRVLSATVNTCQISTNGSLFIVKTFPLQIQTISPNPVRDEAIITYSLQEQAQTELSVVNIYGQTVKKIVQGEMLPGIYSGTISAIDLPSGTYFLHLKTPTESTQLKIEVLR